ncbi:hypothetical protein LL912_03410 [Niabella sp. CC-SYL272]|uniref:hypothetical protein n=1 Tax=Niabella agricola TaxID=2891571 RepID=UPI001F30035C|nr:hypothetical protein [Niabella agricola]MCF3107819.1 hypothetical protein [Niabella agricola]
MTTFQLLITICVLPLMLLTGFYLYRYINQKLLASETWAQIISFGLLLFVSIAATLCGGLLLMAWLYRLYQH